MQKEEQRYYTCSFTQKIIHGLKDPAAVDKNLHFYVKKNRFQVLNMPSLGIQNILVVPNKGKEVTTFAKSYSMCDFLYFDLWHFIFYNVQDNTLMVKYKKVLFVEDFLEDFFEDIKEVHEKVVLRVGNHKPYEKVFPF